MSNESKLKNLLIEHPLVIELECGIINRNKKGVNKILREKEVLWRENKYEVMSHSENSYRFIQKVLIEITLTDLSKLIEEAKTNPRTVGSVTNTYEHIWGYFKKRATIGEKDTTFKLLDDFRKGEEQDEELWIWLAKLAKKYEQEYLLNSTLIARYSK